MAEATETAEAVVVLAPVVVLVVAPVAPVVVLVVAPVVAVVVESEVGGWTVV